MLNEEFITVVANGQVFTGWERVKVTAGIQQAARSFSVETTEQIGEWKFPPGTPIEIYANGDLMIRGYVNAYQASGQHDAHRITIQGRGKGQDFVDCSAEHATHEFDNQSPLQAGQALDVYGIGISADIPLDSVPRMHVVPGESPFQFLERYLRPVGASMMGMPEGGIRITDASAARSHYGILMEGQNIKTFMVDLNDGSRHSKYVARGQSRSGTGATRLRTSGSASDRGVRRRRTRVLANETDSDQGRVRSRARHERDRAAGRSVKAAVQVQGFRDFAGELYTPNRLIYVHAPILMHLATTMLIEQVQFSQDNRSGSLCDLQLVDPRAYRGQRPARGAAGQAGQGAADSNDQGDTDAAWVEGY